MSAPIQTYIGHKILISGPARTGKSEQIISRIKEYAESNTNFILIVPTSDYLNQYKRLIAENSGGLFDTSVLSLDDLIKKIEQQSDQKVYESAQNFQLHRMVSDIIEDKVSGGELQYFKEASKLLGFAAELLKLFGEFVQSLIKPNDLLELKIGWKQQQKLSEIRLLYEEYLTECEERKIGSKDFRLSKAVEYLSTENGIFNSVQAIIVDGFYDYTPLQKKLFRILFEKFNDTLVTHLYDDNRKTVFKYTERAIDLFEGFKSVPPKFTEWRDSPAAMIRENIFEEEVENLKNTADIPISIIEEPGSRKLVEAIARRVKRLIVDENIRPSEVGIIFRQGKEFPKLIEQTFTRFGIPVSINKGLPLSEYQSVNYLKKLLSVNPERYTGSEVRGLLTSNYTRILSGTEEVDVDFLLKVMREAGATEDKRSCLKRLEAYLAKSKADYHQTKESIQAIETAISVIQDILDMFTPPKGLNRNDIYIEYVRKVVEFMGIESLLSPMTDSTQLSNRYAFEKSMKILDALDEKLPAGKTRYSDFRNTFFMALDEEKLRDRENLSGGVEVMKVMDARWMSFHTVFICELSEGAFPVMGHSTGLLSNRIRNLLDKKTSSALSKGAEIIHDEEKLLYYISLGRADERIFLCYSSVDAEGRDVIRSSFVDATESVYKKLTGQDALPVHSGNVKKMFDSTSPAASKDELMRAIASTGVIDRDVLISAGVNAESLNHLISMVDVRRKQMKKIPSYSGIIDDPIALNLLSEIQSDKIDWSATEIEKYGKCPFLYLIEKIWNVQIEEEFKEEVTPLEKGSFYHDVLKLYYSAIIDGNSDNSLAGNKKVMSNAIQSVLKYDKYQKHGIAPILWELSSNEAKEVLLRFVEEEQEKREDSVSPIAVETAFGMKARKNESPYSTEIPFILEYEGFNVRLKGRIDRIDANEDFSEYSVLDYKSGSSVPNRKSISNGINLQLPLYIEAVRKTILGDKNSEPHSGYYYGLQKLRQTFAFKKDDSDNWDDVFKVTKDFVGEYVGNIRSGKFPVEPKDCKLPCEWSNLCRFAETSNV